MPHSSSPERARRLVQSLSRWRSRAGRQVVRAATVLALAVAIALPASTGTLQPFENALQNVGFAMRSHAASGQIHVVEMDAASVAAIQRWPWDREHYAQVVERLDEAGARTIAFDVDFSSASDREQDERFDIDNIDAEALRSQANWLNQYPNKRARIEGHADERGTREYNLALGERRANAAKNYLQSLGISASRLSVVSYGKERPVALGSNESAWSQNRRAVTVTID